MWVKSSRACIAQTTAVNYPIPAERGSARPVAWPCCVISNPPKQLDFFTFHILRDSLASGARGREFESTPTNSINDLANLLSADAPDIAPETKLSAEAGCAAAVRLLIAAAR